MQHDRTLFHGAKFRKHKTLKNGYKAVTVVHFSQKEAKHACSEDRILRPTATAFDILVWKQNHIDAF